MAGESGRRGLRHPVRGADPRRVGTSSSAARAEGACGAAPTAANLGEADFPRPTSSPSPTPDDGAAYAGCEPSALWRRGRGGAWEELDGPARLPSAPTWSFPPRPWTSHVRWIAPSPHDPDLAPRRHRARRPHAERGRRRDVERPPARRTARLPLARVASHRARPRVRGGRRRRGVEPDGGATWTPPTPAVTATTRGRSSSTRPTPSAGSSRPARALRRARRDPPRRASTAGRATARGRRSTAAFRGFSRRCPTPSRSSTGSSSPASPTAGLHERRQGRQLGAGRPRGRASEADRRLRLNAPSRRLSGRGDRPPAGVP